MSRPKAYDPEQGQYAQLFCRIPRISMEWEHLGYVETKTDLLHDMEQYRFATGHHPERTEYKYIILPAKYWDEDKVQADIKQRREAMRKRRSDAAAKEEIVKRLDTHHWCSGPYLEHLLPYPELQTKLAATDTNECRFTVATDSGRAVYIDSEVVLETTMTETEYDALVKQWNEDHPEYLDEEE